MRRSFLLRCSAIDLDGTPSKYYPRFRPRRLVMPVDPSDVNGAGRQSNPLYEKVKAQQRARRQAEKRGAVQLGTVPSERSVGDAYRLFLDACAAQQLFSDAALTPRAIHDLESLVKAHDAAVQQLKKTAGGDAPAAVDMEANDSEKLLTFQSPLYALALKDSVRAASSPSVSHAEAPLAEQPIEPPSHGLSLREVDAMWAMLDRTPLSAPVHGALALRGEALVRSTLLELVYAAFPRLRSKHVQQLLHETTGLLPCGRIAARLGLAEHCGVEGDIAMWRELNVLTERLRIARKQATIHLQRLEKGVAAQRRWYWRGVLRSAAGRLRLFPVHKEDLQPRLQWVRSSLFAFLAFVEVAEQSGDAAVHVKPLIHQLFASQLARHVRRRQILEKAAAIAATTAASPPLPREKAGTPSMSPQAAEEEVTSLAGRIADELQRVQARTIDEEEVLEGRTHPMNRRADRQREQFESSGGAHGTQALMDEALARHTDAYERLAPPLLLHALESVTPNAFKEAQLVLRYAPEVSEKLRRAPIDVDQVVRHVVDVQETNNYASLHHAQQYRQVAYTVCRLYSGAYCLGEGKGETLMSAMQDASLEVLFHYYLRHPASAAAASPLEAAQTGPPRDGRTAADRAVPASEARDGAIPAPRIRPPKTEEEIVL